MSRAGDASVAARIRLQGWDQGCLLDRRVDLFLADLRTPLTAASSQLAVQQGTAPRAVVEVNYDPEQSPGMIIVSQLCDLVASDREEPMCEAIPLLVVPDDLLLPGPHSSRYFTLDAHRRLVGDQTRRLVFEKALLPDRAATSLLDTDVKRQAFRAWIARRPARIAFDDDLIDTIGAAINRTLGSGLGNRPQLGTMFSWRVLSRIEEGRVEVGFLIPYDEQHEAATGIDEYVGELEERIRSHLPRAHARANQRRGELGLPPVAPHRLSTIAAVPADSVSLRQLLTYPAFNLEHLTYAGDAIDGVSPVDADVG